MVVVAQQRRAVVGVQLEQEGAEHTALEGVTANPNCLWSVCEVQYPAAAECGTQAQTQFHWGGCVEYWDEIDSQHSDVGVIISRCVDWVKASGYDILCGSVDSECKLGPS